MTQTTQMNATTELEQYLSKSYDWVLNVLRTQGRWLTPEEFWIAFPFKKRVNKEHFTALINAMQGY